MHVHLAWLIVGLVLLMCGWYANDQLNPSDVLRKLVRVLLFILGAFVVLQGFGLLGGPEMTIGW